MASKLLMITVFIFDLIAFGLAVAAEQRRSKARTQTDSEKNYVYCVYDFHISTGYGVGAFLFLVASEVIILIATRCFCCGKALELVLFSFSSSADCLEGIDAQNIYGYAICRGGQNVVLNYSMCAADAEGRSFHHGRFVQKLLKKAASLPM